jgi:hypothetical protein
MTEEEWMQLQVRESAGRKISSIQLDGPPHRSSSKRSSILKWPSTEAQPASASVVSNDALQPIREKCLMTAGVMKVESILRKLCEDNDAEHQMSSTGCFARGQN